MTVQTVTELLDLFPDRVEERDGYLVLCPTHEDTKPSLRITVSDSDAVLLKCRAGCGTGDVVKALGMTRRELDGAETPDWYALSTLDVSGWPLDSATSRDAPASPGDVAALAVDLDRWAGTLTEELTHTAQAALRYAEDRFGITAQDADRLGLGATDDLPGGPRLVVPFRDRDGVARGYQARALDANAAVRWLGPASPQGASWARTAYFPGGAGWDEVLITEGPGDALTGAALGYDTIGIRGAGLATNETVLADVAALVGDRLAVIAGDGDPAGRAFAATLAQGLLALGVRVKVLPVPERHDLTSWRGLEPHRFATDVIRLVAQTVEEVAVSAVLSERDLDRYPFTDLGNARYVRDFVAAQSSGIKYAPEIGFYLLHSGIWQPDGLDRTRAYAHEAADRTGAIARELVERAGTDKDAAARAGKWAKWATYSQSSKGISSALQELRALPDVAADVERFDQQPNRLAVANGVVDLRTGELLPHDPALLLTKRIDVAYDEHAAAPRWERFLDELFPAHAELPKYIQRLVGYGITGHTDEQCFAVLWGTGANGKSVLTDTLTEVFRDVTVTTPFSTFEEKQSGGIPNDLAALKGARLVMASEGDQGRPMAEAVLKRVTGRDLIAARFMRKEFFEFRPSFLLMLATNFKPRFKGQDEGLWRRVKLIPFERYFAPHERDHKLGDQLLIERAGILAWAVRGAMLWYRDGLSDPDTITGATREYRETSDALAGFLPGVYVTDTGDGARVDGAMLFRSYLEWADEENLPLRERWRRATFYDAVAERGYAKRKTNRGVAFEGLRRARPSDGETESPAPAAEPAASPVTLTRGASLAEVL